MAMRSWTRAAIAAALVVAACGGSGEHMREQRVREQWTAAEATAWYDDQPWLVGSNFIPSTASNQLEMWQAETFDPATIDRELGFAADLGLNTMRVFLHDIPWRQDARGFLDRVDRFLAIAAHHHIRIMLVLFDGVWDPFPKAGPQPEPRPLVHNSRWLQSPGAEILADAQRQDELEPYVRAVVRRFRNDRRVLAWDLFNEPDNPNPAYAQVELAADDKAAAAERLLARAFVWARAENPSQPLTAGVWRGSWDDTAHLSSIDRLMLGESDIVTFHSYAAAASVEESIAALRAYGRPVLCTEWLARTVGSTVDSVLPLFARQRVGAYNWGLVRGRTQTNFSWLSWLRPDPTGAAWFHDLLERDGSPFDAAEAALIRSLAGDR
jgi:hypothetical protein